MRTYLIRTFGCQMNKHDSERVAGLLESCSMTPVTDPAEADVVVFMTCCVRENAEERLRGQAASLKALKGHGEPGPLIAIGGCIGQRDGAELLRRLPHVDVIFGTNNIKNLPALLDAAQTQHQAQVEVLNPSNTFADLPSRREHPWHAWVPITVGCDNHCSYCIVPRVRGYERSRPLEDIVAEVARLVDEGTLEVTLLGQNVNSYGRDLYGAPRFAEALRAVAGTGIKRIRFATSHPKDLSDTTIAAIASEPAVMPYLHLPVQSGSDRILARMNRVYTRDEYLALVSRVRERIPGIALSTDIIVGFPGETDGDFEDTLDVVRQADFVQAFTFLYSPREGTPAAAMEGRVPREVMQQRFDHLIDLVQASALRFNSSLIGTQQEMLVESASKRDERMLSGRIPTNQMVHVPLPEGHCVDEFAGRIMPVVIEDARTWFLSAGFVVDGGQAG